MNQPSADIRAKTKQALGVIATVLPPRDVNIDDETPVGKKTIGIYALLFFENGIKDGDAVMRGAKLFLSSESERFFPAPGILMPYCLKAQEDIERERFRMLYADPVSYEDENGWPCIAPRNRVRNGRLLPEGDTSGDGSLAPASLPEPKTEESEKRKRAKALARSLVGNPRHNDNVRVGGLQRLAK